MRFWIPGSPCRGSSLLPPWSTWTSRTSTLETCLSSHVEWRILQIRAAQSKRKMAKLNYLKWMSPWAELAHFHSLFLAVSLGEASYSSRWWQPSPRHSPRDLSSAWNWVVRQVCFRDSGARFADCVMPLCVCLRPEFRMQGRRLHSGLLIMLSNVIIKRPSILEISVHITLFLFLCELQLSKLLTGYIFL